VNIKVADKMAEKTYCNCRLHGGLTMVHLPFSVSRRKGRRFYYVQFKREKGEYLPAISTKQTTEAAAIETAFKWLREGIPSRKNDINVDLLMREALREIKTTSEADFVCRELKRLGLLKTYVIPMSKQDVDFVDFLYGFWDYDTSPYVKERLRKNHGIHRNYTTGQRCIAERLGAVLPWPFPGRHNTAGHRKLHG
jgi:hypothetical protein